MVRRVEVVEHDPGWEAQFQAEAVSIAAVFGGQCVAIHHIGSTAIPGILAKPTIDILLEVKDLLTVDQFNEAMIATGYQPLGEYGIPGRRFFIKEIDGRRAFHVHAFQTSHPEVARHIEFRDYLHAHPDVAQAYSRLKADLAARYSEDIVAYVEGKTNFIRAIQGKARSA